MAFYDPSFQYCPDTGRSIGEYIIFYQGGPIDHDTHVLGPVDESSAESEYNSAYTAITSLASFRMLIHEFLNKDPDIVPEEDPIIILDSKSAVCMDKNGKDTNNISNIARRVHISRNGEK